MQMQGYVRVRQCTILCRAIADSSQISEDHGENCNLETIGGNSPGRVNKINPILLISIGLLAIWYVSSSFGEVKKIEAIIKPFKAEPVKEALMAAGVEECP